MTDIINQIRAEIRESLAYFQINGRLAEDIADASTNRIKRILAGNKIYIAKLSRNERQRRQQIIKAEFDGKNKTAICRRFGISPTTLFRLTQGKPKVRGFFWLRLLVKIKQRPINL